MITDDAMWGPVDVVAVLADPVSKCAGYRQALNALRAARDELDEEVSGVLDWAARQLADGLSGIDAMEWARAGVRRAERALSRAKNLYAQGRCRDAGKVVADGIDDARTVLEQVRATNLTAALGSTMPDDGQKLGLVAIALGAVAVYLISRR